MLYSKIALFLRARGVTVPLVPDTRTSPGFRLEDAGDGVVKIAEWDVSKLGVCPSVNEVLTAIPDAVAVTETNVARRDKTLWTPPMVALVRALNARLRAANVDSLTVGAFRSAIEAEYDAILEQR